MVKIRPRKVLNKIKQLSKKKIINNLIYRLLVNICNYFLLFLCDNIKTIDNTAK